MHPTPTADDWSELPDDPIVLLERWLPRNDDPERPLMTLATIDADGLPDARSLLLSEWDAAGFYWHADARSRKIAQVTRVPAVALCLPLLGTPRSVYLRQLAWQNTPEFAARPQQERIAAWDAFARAHAGTELAPPPTWTGYLVRPARLTFWFGSSETASRRLEYARRDDVWERRILAG